MNSLRIMRIVPAHYRWIVLLAAIVICFTDCSDDETQQERTRKLLVGRWHIRSAAIDGVDETATCADMTLTFSATDFSTTNGGAVWPVTGTWILEEGSAVAFEREDGVIISITALTERTLNLDFNWDEREPGMPGYNPRQFRFSFIR